MRFILMLDKRDEQIMKNGEMIQIPGQTETFLTFEPSSRKQKLANAHIGNEQKQLTYQKKTLPLVTCAKCKGQFKGNVGLSTHSRNCTGRK